MTSNNVVLDKKIPQLVLDAYAKPLQNLIDCRSTIENEPKIDSVNVKISEEANKKILEYMQRLIDLQKKQIDHTHEYIAKIQITILKLTLLVHLIKHAKTNSFETEITLNTVETAIVLNDFYFTNFKIVLEELKKKDKRYFAHRLR